MSVNLVDLIMSQVGDNLPGILGSLLGESADRTQGAIAGAVPAILGGLMGAASKGGDVADQLAAAVGQQDDGLLNNLAGAFGGGNHQEIANQGGSMLTSLLGDGMVGSLVGAIGKFSGLGGGSTKSLLGMLVPVVMSVLSREQKSQGLDGGGLMALLSSQKDNIQAAMPSGLSSALGGAGLLDDLMGTAQSATSSISEAAESAAGKVGQAVGGAAVAVGDAADQVGDAARDAASSASAAVGQGVDAAGRAAQNVASGASGVASDASAAAAGAAQAGGSWLRWLLPLLILLAVLWFAFKYLGGSSVEETASNAGDAVSSAVEATTEAASDATEAATDAASSAVEATTDAAGDAAEAVTDAASDAADAAGDATAAASDAATDAVDAAAGAASDAAGSALETVTAMVGDIDVGGELTSTFSGLTETLSGITDVASAEAALPKLEEMSTSLDSLTGLADQLPEGAVSAISEMVGSGLSGLDGVMATLEAIPGVGDLVKPIIDQIKEKLAAFTVA